MPDKRTKALLILSAAFLIVIGITWTELNSYKQGNYESYRGERSAFDLCESKSPEKHFPEPLWSQFNDRSKSNSLF